MTTGPRTGGCQRQEPSSRTASSGRCARPAVTTARRRMWVVPLPLASAEPPPPRWYCWILAHQIRLAGRRAAVEWVHEVGFRIGTFREPAAPGLCHDCRARPALAGAAACAVCAERRADRRKRRRLEAAGREVCRDCRIMPTTVGTRCARCADVAAAANRRYRERNRDVVNRPARERAGRRCRDRVARGLCPLCGERAPPPGAVNLSDGSGPRPRRVSEVARGEVNGPAGDPGRVFSPGPSSYTSREYRPWAPEALPEDRLEAFADLASSANDDPSGGGFVAFQHAKPQHRVDPGRRREGGDGAAFIGREGRAPVAELDEPPGGLGDGDRPRLGRVAGGRHVRRQVGRERERLERRARRVARGSWPFPSHVQSRSDQSSWNRLCRMPKVTSSSRAMTISWWSGQMRASYQTNSRCLATVGVAMKPPSPRSILSFSLAMEAHRQPPLLGVVKETSLLRTRSSPGRGSACRRQSRALAPSVSPPLTPTLRNRRLPTNASSVAVTVLSPPPSSEIDVAPFRRP